MNHKSAVVQEAEEIIQRYIRQQAALSRKFQIKSKRKLPTGILLLLGVTAAVVLGIAMLYFL